ncbi:hypothetical protein BrevBR_03195 [Brevundimonas sp. BR2-1]|uniref:hypothetical protein n=1 Tax=Brevundimonas sp. BR2-1 TaxID=3031123 RepID=UPI0030ADDD39
MDAPPLQAFCAEMERLGAAIQAPREMLPHCGATTDAGYHVLIAADGRYSLVYSERGVPGVVASSSSPEVLMERVFVEVTTNMASTAVANEQPPLDTAEVLRMDQLSEEQLRDAAVDYHLRTSRIQEALLGKLNPEWRERQSDWNAGRLRETKQFFSEGSKD